MSGMSSELKCHTAWKCVSIEKLFLLASGGPDRFQYIPHGKLIGRKYRLGIVTAISVLGGLTREYTLILH